MHYNNQSLHFINETYHSHIIHKTCFTCILFIKRALNTYFPSPSFTNFIFSYSKRIEHSFREPTLETCLTSSSFVVLIFHQCNLKQI